MSINSSKISFIPKSSVIKRAGHRSRPRSLFLFLSLSLFFLSLVAYGGLYFYEKNLTETLNIKANELENEKKKADPTGIIDRAIDLENRTANGSKLLKTHVATSRVFELLEEITLKSVVLKSLVFTTGESNGNSDFTVEVKGIAPSYSSLIYQSDVFKKDIKDKQRINNFSIHDLGLNDNGDVLFTLSINLNPISFHYENTVETFTLEEDDTFDIDEFESFIGGDDLQFVEDIFNQVE